MDINWIIDSPMRALPVGDADTVALSIEGEESLTYGELEHRRNQWITALVDANVQPGDRVGIMLLNSCDYIALYFAIARLGAIAVRLNYRLAPDELRYVISDSGCSLLVLHTSRIRQVESIVTAVDCDNWLVVRDDDTDAPSWATHIDAASLSATNYDGPRPAGSDPMMLMYSSGTTGRPKGIVWTHEQGLWLALMQATRWSFTPETVAMTTGPFYHAGAFEVLLLPALFVHGTAVGMGSGGVTTPRILEAARRSGATDVTFFSFTVYDLLRDDTLDLTALDNVKWLMSGGDVLQEWAVRAFDERLPHIELGQGYGLTEGGTMSTYLDHAHRLTHAGTIGRPFILTDVEVRDDAGKVCAPGDTGEIWIRSNTMTPGYWNRPEANAETFVDGWCRTGDLGRVSTDGFLTLAGRAKDMIRSGGENIYPAEVETVLVTHPGVKSIAIVGVPDETYIEVGCAVVVPTGPDVDLTVLEAELRTTARERLAGYKCPKHYQFVGELPLNHSGKILKTVLRAQYEHVGSTLTPPN